jgi:hypothetical protein
MIAKSTTTPEKYAFILDMIRHDPNATGTQIQDALGVKFSSRVHNSVLAAARAEVRGDKPKFTYPGGKPGPKPKAKPAPKPKGKPGPKPKRLSDAQVAMLTKAAPVLSISIRQAIARLQKELNDGIESITVYRGKDLVRITRSVEQEIVL